MHAQFTPLPVNVLKTMMMPLWNGKRLRTFSVLKTHSPG